MRSKQCRNLSRMFRARLQVCREILHVNHLSHAHHGCVANDILKLAHVDRPGMLRKPDLRAMSQSPDLFSVLRGEPGDEVALE